MNLEVNGKTVTANDAGFLLNPDQWNEDVCKAIAARDGIELFVDHWELIYYVREYFEQNQTCPTMHTMVQDLAPRKQDKFHDKKEYEKHLYKLVRSDAAHEICKLAGLPMPQPDD